MRAEVGATMQPQPNWAGLGGFNMHNVNVTIAAPLASDESERMMRMLSNIDGVVRVEPRAPAPTPVVPAEELAFATRLWEVL